MKGRSKGLNHRRQLRQALGDRTEVWAWLADADGEPSNDNEPLEESFAPLAGAADFEPGHDERSPHAPPSDDEQAF